jgi:hypothetical protein
MYGVGYYLWNNTLHAEVVDNETPKELFSKYETRFELTEMCENYVHVKHANFMSP